MLSLQIIEKRKKLEADGSVQLSLLWAWLEGSAGAWLSLSPVAGAGGGRDLPAALSRGAAGRAENFWSPWGSPALLGAAEPAANLSLGGC